MRKVSNPHLISGMPLLRLAVFALTSIASVCVAQQGQSIPVHVSFGFRTNLVDGRLGTNKRQIEIQIGQQLARTCSQDLNSSQVLIPWGCDTGSGVPALELWTDVRPSSSYFLEMRLNHAPGRPEIVDHWETLLVTREDLEAFGGLPSGDQWTTMVVSAFKRMTDGATKSGSELEKALEELAPLGKAVAVVSPVAGQEPGAVLPLSWDKYKDLSYCRFRIFYRNSQNFLIAIHSDGVGRPSEFTPATPTFQGILVVHKKWQLGASPDDIETIKDHLSDLSGLIPVEFYLEDRYTLPAGLSEAK